MTDDAKLRLAQTMFASGMLLGHVHTLQDLLQRKEYARAVDANDKVLADVRRLVFGDAAADIVADGGHVTIRRADDVPSGPSTLAEGTPGYARPVKRTDGGTPC